MATSAEQRAELRRRQIASRFSALGDPTRLRLVERLSDGKQCSIVQLCDGSTLTRQAVRKHLDVLEGAALVRSERAGRECHYTLEAAAFGELQSCLAHVGAQWQAALGRLKAFVET